MAAPDVNPFRYGDLALDEAFTDANLSRCFGVPLFVERRQARWAAWSTS